MNAVTSKPADVACAHCGLPVPGGRAVEQAQFCCVGCEAVYGALREQGLEAFYQIREMGERSARRVEEVGEGPAALLDSEGYLAEQTEVLADGTRTCELYLEGVHCAGCVWITEQMPHFVEGVKQARLDLPRARLELRWDPSRVKLSEASAWLGRFGYAARPMRAEGVDARREVERKLLGRVGISWAIAGNIMLLAVVLYAGLDMADDPGLTHAVRGLSLALATVSVAYGGAEFFRRAWLSMRGLVGPRWRQGWLRLSMDVPISLGIGVGWLHSAVATVTGAGEIWFDSIAVLIAALLTARWLQIRGRRGAGDAADRLLSLVPTVARRVVGEMQTEEVSVECLAVGDRVEVRGGDAVPVDGVVVEGRTALHRAVLTGESRPEAVAPGDRVHAGENNVGSRVVVRVEAAGEATRVGKLLSWVDERNRRRAPVVQWADRLGGIFVLVTLVAAVVTGVVWSSVAGWSVAVGHVVALLVVACPCALGMATPLALAVGVGRAAGRGIYVKHDDVLQASGQVTHVVLDKTGTLTCADMVVETVVGSRRHLRRAAALERYSVHPLAAAIREAVEAQGAEVARGSVAETPGAGIEGVVDGKKVVVGRPDWVRERCSGSAGWSMESALEDVVREGRTPVAVGVDGVVEVVLGVGDPLREESWSLVERLKAEGVELMVLSGDHAEVVRGVARRLGISEDRALGGMSPEEKYEVVKRLKREGERVVAMVGDGVNDAAALQAADIGVAVNGGAEASLVAADVFTTRQGLEPVWELLQGSRDVGRVVRRNLVASAGYNALAVVAAALGLIGPLAAALAMPASSIAVVLSSLLQPSFDRTGEAEERGVAERGEERRAGSAFGGRGAVAAGQEVVAEREVAA